MKIRELMQHDVVSVDVDTPVKDVAALLVGRHISGVPVLFADGRVAGVLSQSDIRPGVRSARDAMSMPAIVLPSSHDVDDAARLMASRQINRIPIVDDGRLVGILTRSDLVRAFCRDDGTIEEEIRSDVLLATLWIDPDAVDVEVRDGVVTLRGTVETKTVAELVAAYVRRVPGVVDVEPALRWRVDDTLRRRATLRGRMPVRVR